MTRGFGGMSTVIGTSDPLSRRRLTFTGDGRGKTHIRSDTVRRARAEGPAGLGSGSSRAPRRRACVPAA